MATLEHFLRSGATGDLLPWSAQQSAMARFGLSCAEVEAAALSIGLLPARYQRNRQTISTAGQRTLLRSRVAVVGCGGLGGYVIEELARLGVGRLVVIDPDRFEEHNLNRQLLSSLADLGRAKVEAAASRVASVNPAVVVIPRQVAFCAANGGELLAGVDLVVDALDSIPVRRELAATCSTLRVPLVHGAIGGWYGHVATQFPGEQVLEFIYGSCTEAKGVEQELGNPSFTPAVVASLQVAEACKLLLGEGVPLRGRHLHVDLRCMEIVELPASPRSLREGERPVSPDPTSEDLAGAGGSPATPPAARSGHEGAPCPQPYPGTPASSSSAAASSARASPTTS